MITYTFEDGTTIRIDPLVVSQRIKNVLEEKNMSLQELSDLTGIAKSSLQRYSSGATDKIPTDRLVKIALKTHTSIFYLLGQDVPMEEEPTLSTTDLVVRYGSSNNDKIIVELNKMARSMKEKQLERLILYAEFLLSKGEDE